MTGPESTRYPFDAPPPEPILPRPGEWAFTLAVAGAVIGGLLTGPFGYFGVPFGVLVGAVTGASLPLRWRRAPRQTAVLALLAIGVVVAGAVADASAGNLSFTLYTLSAVGVAGGLLGANPFLAVLLVLALPVLWLTWTAGVLGYLLGWLIAWAVGRVAAPRSRAGARPG